MMALWGTLYGLGAGAGHREWLTLEADRILKQASVIALPTDSNRPGRAETIIASYLTPGKRVLRLHFPMTRDQGVLNQAWDKAADDVYPVLAEGVDVVFVTEGDPSLYSTFSYLAERIQVRWPAVPIRFLPGVSSVLAASARWGHVLTQSQESLAIVSASHNLARVIQALDVCDTVIIVKVAAVFTQVYELLQSRHLLSRTVYLSHIGWDNEEIVSDLGTLISRKLPYMSLLIVKTTRLEQGGRS